MRALGKAPTRKFRANPSTAQLSGRIGTGEPIRTSLENSRGGNRSRSWIKNPHPCELRKDAAPRISKSSDYRSLPT